MSYGKIKSTLIKMYCVNYYTKYGKVSQNLLIFKTLKYDFFIVYIRDRRDI